MQQPIEFWFNNNKCSWHFNEFQKWIENGCSPDFNDHVKQLDLSNCNIKVFPREIINLKSLVYLDISHNHLESIPDDFKLLKELTYLDISHNNLSSFPEFGQEFGSELEVLDLSHNTTMHTTPIGIFMMASLKELGLSCANTTAIPPEIKNLTSLNKLYISFNKSS